MNKVKKLSLIVLLGALMSLAFSATSMAASKKIEEGEDGKLYYYVGSKLTTDRIGVKVDGKYYSVNSKGVAKEIKDEALGLAKVRLTKLGITPETAKDDESLRTAFDWCWNNIKNVSMSQSGKSKSWYAQYGFNKKRGDCNVYAATFYYLARGLGYSSKETKMVKGYILSGYNSKGKKVYGSHAWVTIQFNGKTRVFDPNFAYVYHNPKGAGYGTKNVNDGYKMGYTKLKADKKKGLTQYTYYYKKSGKYKKYK